MIILTNFFHVLFKHLISLILVQTLICPFAWIKEILFFNQHDVDYASIETTKISAYSTRREYVSIFHYYDRVVNSAHRYIIYYARARHFITVLRVSIRSKLTRASPVILILKLSHGGLLPIRISRDSPRKLDSKLTEKVIAAERKAKVACENVNSDVSASDFPVFRVYSNLPLEISE